MQNISLEIVLSYINSFVLVFFISLVGAIVRNIFDTLNNLTKINIHKILISTVFCSITLQAIFQYINANIAISVFICFFLGMWSYRLLEISLNWKIVKKFLAKVLRNSGNAVGEALSETITEMEEDDDIHKTKKEELNKKGNNTDHKKKEKG